ncbi:hypothetical protein ACLHTC_26470 [Pseudomonas aeruginosa]|uniref:hypothetical protein n=1 Tax=Pseudomonas aeruginosa TaxID=287 RepID=UPI002772AAE5|nr:hypothetical protein [Pseudomonas aeruginosa]HCI2610032.1 hypothetical protein [Pseudomonas aeruginosa]
MFSQEFTDELLLATEPSALKEFCQRKVLHGTPIVFKDREDDYYHFKKLIADQFNIDHHEIYITGSAKLGFSPIKGKKFDLDSDIDIAIISTALFENIMSMIYDYQSELRRNRRSVTEKELQTYHSFLEYTAIGWIRPDKLPTSFQTGKLREKWFDFFNSISYGKSSAGNYKISAGAFKSYKHLELYTIAGMKELQIAKSTERT